MLRSMTAYARAAEDAEWGHAVWELRAVNNRYLDVVFRMPEELRALETRLRERVVRRIRRGKLECNLRLTLAARAEGDLEVDVALARQLAATARTLSELVGTGERLAVGEYLRWPGVVRQNPPDPARIEAPITALLEHAVDDLSATREREGARIAELVRTRCDQIDALVTDVRARYPVLIDAARERLRARLAELAQSVDSARVEQEIVILATKMDVAEELDRLQAHTTEVRGVLEREPPAGRRLDFLMQELNREANTLGSKSNDAQTTRASVDLKVLIEQIREQVQNVE